MPHGWRWFLLALFLAALGWQMTVLARLAAGPLLTHLSADADAYWRWASRIRSGEWVPSRPFFLAPLYPYWLALVRSIVGDRIVPVLVVQAFLGSGAVVLLADATRQMSTPRAGALVGLAAAGYAMAVVFDLLVLGESLLFLLGSLALWLVVQPDRVRPARVGLLIALLGLGRPSFLLLLIPFGAWLLAHMHGRRFRSLALCMAAPVVVVLTTAAYHARVDGAWMPITYSGGYNFYVGNGPLANGTYVDVAGAFELPPTPRPEDSEASRFDGRGYIFATSGQRLSASESSEYWVRQTIAQIRTDPTRWIFLLMRKLGLLFNRRELPQITDPAAFEQAYGPLGWPLDWEFLPFGVVGLVGGFVAWRAGGRRRLVGAWGATLALGFSAFFIVDRYRIHLLPPLALLAGVGGEAMVEIIRRRSRRAMALLGAGLAAVTGLVLAPMVPDNRTQRRWSYAITMGDAFLAHGEPARALASYEEAMAIDRARSLGVGSASASRLARGALYENAGTAHELLGEEDRAIENLEVAVRLAPEARSLRLHYADQLARSKRGDEARAQYAAAGMSIDAAAAELVRRAEGEEARGNRRATVELLAAAVDLRPGFEPAVIPLVRAEILLGDLDAASRHLHQAESLGLDSNVVRAHAAWLCAARRDTQAARHEMESIPAAIRVSDPRVVGTLELMRRHAASGFAAGR
jgi:tetratricopeptide (TPR) repeat protein